MVEVASQIPGTALYKFLLILNTIRANVRRNALKKYRESLLLSKAELARMAQVSPITLSRIEKGLPCRMETKRKIILALGLNLSEKSKVFEE